MFDAPRPVRLIENDVRISDNYQRLVSQTFAGLYAREMQDRDPGSVVFLDFEGHNFGETVVLAPVAVDRRFWSRILGVALGDLAHLVAPARVVLCEGKPADGNRARAEFDARCYRAIFGGVMPDTDFVSVGNERDVQMDRLEVGKAIQTLVTMLKLPS